MGAPLSSFSTDWNRFSARTAPACAYPLRRRQAAGHYLEPTLTAYLQEREKQAGAKFWARRSVAARPGFVQEVRRWARRSAAPYKVNLLFRLHARPQATVVYSFKLVANPIEKLSVLEYPLTEKA